MIFLEGGYEGGGKKYERPQRNGVIWKTGIGSQL